jgi:tetratricopeptide (TPR) repeat protein
MLGFLTGDGVDNAQALATAERLRAEFVSLGDAAGEARAWRLRSQVELTRCRYGDAADSVTAAIEAARRAGDVVLEQRMLPALPSLAVLGPRPVGEVIAQAREVLAAVRTRRGRALVERTLGRLLALDGRVEEGRAMCAATRGVLLELGWNFEAGLISLDLGTLELNAGRPDLAEVELQTGFERLDELGERNYIATVAALLAEAVRALGRHDEALEHARFAEEVADPDDVATQVMWRSVRARVLGALGHVEAARHLVDEALALVLDTDDIAQQGDTWYAAADVAAATGDVDRARTCATKAIEAYTRKGQPFDVERAKALAASLA